MSVAIVPRHLEVCTAVEATSRRSCSFGDVCSKFFGYLYHLDAMSDPYWYDYPQDWLDKTGPRNLVHSFATETDDPTEMPRWGRIGKQKIIDEGPLAPFPNMKDMQGWQEGRKAKYDMESVLDMFQERADAVVHLRHAGLFETVIVLRIHHRLIFRRDVCEDVHARRIVPNKEWLTGLFRLVHEGARRLDENNAESY